MPVFKGAVIAVLQSLLMLAASFLSLVFVVPWLLWPRLVEAVALLTVLPVAVVVSMRVIVSMEVELP